MDSKLSKLNQNHLTKNTKAFHGRIFAPRSSLIEKSNHQLKKLKKIKVLFISL